jgi:hypothetical protein
MEYDVRPDFMNDLPDQRAVSNVPNPVIAALRQPQLVKQSRICGWWQSQSRHLGPHHEKPFGQPGAFEAGMPCYEHSLIFVEAV